MVLDLVEIAVPFARVGVVSIGMSADMSETTSAHSDYPAHKENKIDSHGASEFQQER